MAKFCQGWYKARHLDLKSLINDSTLRNLWLLSSLAGFTTCNMAIRALNLVLDIIALADGQLFFCWQLHVLLVLVPSLLSFV